MAKQTRMVHHVNFAMSNEVQEFLNYLHSNKAKVIAFTKSDTGNQYAILTIQREKDK